MRLQAKTKSRTYYAVYVNNNISNSRVVRAFKHADFSEQGFYRESVSINSFFRGMKNTNYDLRGGFWHLMRGANTNRPEEAKFNEWQLNRESHDRLKAKVPDLKLITN